MLVLSLFVFSPLSENILITARQAIEHDGGQLNQLKFLILSYSLFGLPHKMLGCGRMSLSGFNFGVIGES